MSSQHIGRIAVAGACAIAIGGAAVLVVNALSTNDSHRSELSSADSGPVLPTDCEAESLPLPPGANGGTAEAVDPTGTYVVGYVYARGTSGEITTEPAMWRDGELSGPLDLPHIPERLQDVNSHGVAIGTVSEPVGDGMFKPHALTYVDGESTLLEGEVNSQGLGINENGDLVGTMDHPDTNVTQAAVFTDDGNEYLPIPDDNYFSRAFDIDDDGNIVGVMEDGYPYRWNANGEGEKLTLGDEESYELRPVASAISNGTTVGTAEDRIGRSVAVVWDIDETEGTIVDINDVQSINAEGWLAGRNDDNAAIHVDGELYELPRLSEDPNTEYRANDLSDDGRVIAGNIGMKDTGDARGEAVMWTCR